MPPKTLLAALAVSLVYAAAALAQPAGNTAGSTTFAEGPPPASEPWGEQLADLGDPASRGKSRCIERFARSAAHLAYLEAKLDLTAEQKPLWDKWFQAMTSGAATERQACIAGIPSPDAQVTALDRDARIESLLSARLDTLKTARPALEALYHALTPDQRIAFDRRPMMGRPGWHHPLPGPEMAPL
jgi:periplasmic protein CpxP/Spy